MKIEIIITIIDTPLKILIQTLLSLFWKSTS